MEVKHHALKCLVAGSGVELFNSICQHSPLTLGSTIMIGAEYAHHGRF